MCEKAQILLVLSLCGLTLAVWTLPFLAGALRELWRRYAARGRAEAAFIAVFVLFAVYVGGTKPTNTPSQAQSGGVTGAARAAVTGGGARMSLPEGGARMTLPGSGGRRASPPTSVSRGSRG